MLTLKGRTAVIDGGAGNIGQAVIRAFLQNGMNVVTISHEAAQAAKIAEKYSEYHEQLWAFGGEPRITPEQIAERFGSIDVIVCLAGPFPKPEEIENLPEKEVDIVLGSMRGTVHMVQEYLPYLKKSMHGRVLLASASDAQTTHLPEEYVDVLFGTVKGSMNSFTVLAARRLAKFGVTVNAVATGTNYNVRHPDYHYDHLERFVPLGKRPTDDEIAAAYCYFASEEASSVTGQVLRIDGGLS